MEFRDVIYTKEDMIATITMNRPERLNAITEAMITEMVEAVRDVQQDRNIRVAVLTGAGRGFNSGADVKAVASAGAEGTERPLAQRRNFLREDLHRISRALLELHKPIIASVNGPCAGGGMDLASMCDLRIASEKAIFVMSYINVGLVPSMGGAYYLQRIVGLPKAAELIWTGKTIDAHEAFRIGYVNQVVPHEQLPAATRDLAATIAGRPPVAIELGKRLLYRVRDLDADRALELTEFSQLITLSTEDSREGFRAAAEKRPPVFKGR